MRRGPRPTSMTRRPVPSCTSWHVFGRFQRGAAAPANDPPVRRTGTLGWSILHVVSKGERGVARGRGTRPCARPRGRRYRAAKPEGLWKDETAGPGSSVGKALASLTARRRPAGTRPCAPTNDEPPLTDDSRTAARAERRTARSGRAGCQPPFQTRTGDPIAGSPVPACLALSCPRSRQQVGERGPPQGGRGLDRRRRG